MMLISQVDHAHWRGDRGLWGNAASSVAASRMAVPAVRGHDDGWPIWEQAPRIDPANGKPREFLEMRMTDATAI
jgi:hypothetical protein